MNELVLQLPVVFGVLAAAFAGPVAAIVLLTWRRRIDRARRRSPLARDMLRGPGQTLREQLDETRIDMNANVTILAALPLIVLSLFLAQGHVIGIARALPLAWFYALLILVLVVFGVFKLWKASAHVDNLRAGFDAELAVGQELDQLMRQGAAVFHDLEGEGFNVDHVVIAPQGVFAVETKGFTKRTLGDARAEATVVFDGRALKFPNRTTREPLEQAERQAQWLSRWLTSAVGVQVQALPVLALPGWFVELTGRGAVRVYNGKQLAGLLRAKGAQPLDAALMQQVVHQVEQRCRTVVPTFKAVAAAPAQGTAR